MGTKINILFDGNFLFNKSFSVWSTYHRGKTDEEMKEVLNNRKDKDVLLRKLTIDACHAINKFTNIDRVIFVFDSKSWRYEFYDNYKYALTRVRTDYHEDALKNMFEFRDFMKRKGFIVTQVDGAEGDDIICGWANYFNEVEEQVVIVSADSDLRQLITPYVSVYNNNSKTSKFYYHQYNDWAKDYEIEDVESSVIDPDSVLINKILSGDSSDNIPKLIKGFGEVKFSKMWEMLGGDFERPYPENVDNLTSVIVGMIEEFDPTLVVNETSLRFNVQMVYLSLDVMPKEVSSGVVDAVIDNVDSFTYSDDYILEEVYKRWK